MTLISTPPVRHRDVDWGRGLCKQHDPDLWFNDDTVEAAVIICQTGGLRGLPCPIKDECLQFALSTGQKNGVWGGLTEDQRKVAGWTKSRVRCPGCRSKNVQQMTTVGSEGCLACGLSWKV